MIEDRIYELVASVLSGNASAEEQKELKAWIEADASRMAVWEEIVAVWRDATTAEERARFDAEAAWQKFAASHIFTAQKKEEETPVADVRLRKTFSLKRIAKMWSRIAAVLLPLFILQTGYLFLQNRNSYDESLAVETVGGESATFRLPDGTEVVLEENSKLTFEASDFRKKTRKVSFTGIAYFNVAKDAEHPFVIKTPNMEVKVKGTAFNLKVRPDHKYDVLSLDNGCVEITPYETSKTEVLQPGDEIIYNKQTKLSAIRHRDQYGIGVARELYVEDVRDPNMTQFTSGNGTKENPYVISNAVQMRNMKEVLSCRQMVYFELDSDIDMAGENWSPLNGPEDGYLNWISFNGNNHVIRNFRTGDVIYNGVDYSASFFGVLCGECKNVGFENANVSSVGAGVGILGGYIGHATYHGITRIENCYFTGHVSASSTAGAIGGNVGSKTIIRNCYTDVDVASMNSYAGGVVGKVSAQLDIDGCIVRGNVTGVHAGGIQAGGQDHHTAPANYSNILVASRSIVGKKEAFPLGDFRHGDKQSHLMSSDVTLVNGKVNDNHIEMTQMQQAKSWASQMWYKDVMN